MQPLCVAGNDAGQPFLDLGLAPSGQTSRYENNASAYLRTTITSAWAGSA